jgi:CheY-like chemotaxis protein
MAFSGKILIVDDEAHVRKFVGLIAKSLGTPSLIEAANGQEAVAQYAAQAPDLVLLDVNMPVMDGLSALTAIRQQDPEAVVVMLTSLVNRQTVETCLKAGAAGYVRKDTPKDEIQAELAAIVRETFAED